MSLRNFDVYNRVIEFLACPHKVLDTLPKGYSGLKDQLRRASLSVALNVAEGAGKISATDQRRYYAIARGSAFECLALLDACNILNLVTTENLKPGLDLIERVIAMLTKLVQKGY